ncbi:50S ribosomal protein L24 [Candidatus Woesearchaeota archaeon]|nr:50S ribosomal protein L24 [Candidatus Woesearchaeota archaeon]
MKQFSKSWGSSKKPRKQRKFRLGAPLHVKQKFVHTHLSKELRKKYSKRSIGLRKGDKIKVMHGKFKKHEGKVEMIDLKKTRVFVSGVETAKKDGTKKLLALNPSNLMVVELNLDDKFRQKSMERK